MDQEPKSPQIVHEEIEENPDIDRMVELMNLIKGNTYTPKDLYELGELVEKLKKENADKIRAKF